MGCHTWFFKKENLTLEECKKVVIKNLNSGLEYASDCLLEKNHKILFIEQEIKDWIKYNNRLLEWISKDWLQESCYRLLTNINFYDKKTKNYYVTNESLPHDIFRIGDYPEDKLFSLEETFIFIENNKEKIHRYNKNWQKRLEEFWEKYPDGMIEFG